MGLPQASTMVLFRASEQIMSIILRSLDYHMTQGSSTSGTAADEEEKSSEVQPYFLYYNYSIC